MSHVPFLTVIIPAYNEVGTIAKTLAATRSYLDAPLTDAVVHLVFGGETKGLDEPLRAAYADALYSIPILTPHVRSLNLSNAVSIVVYEAIRQRGAG